MPEFNMRIPHARGRGGWFGDFHVEAMSEDASQRAAVKQAALTYLQQRGFRSAEKLLHDDDDASSAEVKLNEMVTRDALRKAVRCSIQLPAQSSSSYQEGYAALCEWISMPRPPAQVKEFNEIRFPLFVHCYLAIVAQQPADASRFLRVSCYWGRGGESWGRGGMGPRTEACVRRPCGGSTLCQHHPSLPLPGARWTVQGKHEVEGAIRKARRHY